MVPMPTGEHPFKEIVIGFVGELPESKGFKTILVVTDQFTKVKNYISAKTTLTLEDMSDSYIKDTCRLHSLPRHITLDCGLQLPRSFWKS